MEKLIVTLLQATWVLAFWVVAGWFGTQDATTQLAESMPKSTHITQVVHGVRASLSNPDYPVN